MTLIIIRPKPIAIVTNDKGFGFGLGLVLVRSSLSRWLQYSSQQWPFPFCFSPFFFLSLLPLCPPLPIFFYPVILFMNLLQPFFRHIYLYIYTCVYNRKWSWRYRRWIKGLVSWDSKGWGSGKASTAWTGIPSFFNIIYIWCGVCVVLYIYILILLFDILDLLYTLTCFVGRWFTKKIINVFGLF